GSLAHRPAPQHPAMLEPEVPVQPGAAGIVLLHHEHRRPLAAERRSRRRLGGAGEVALGAIGTDRGVADDVAAARRRGRRAAATGITTPLHGSHGVLRIPPHSFKVAACAASIASAAPLANSTGNSASPMCRCRILHPPGGLPRLILRPCCAATRKRASAAWTFCVGGWFRTGPRSPRAPAERTEAHASAPQAGQRLASAGVWPTVPSPTGAVFRFFAIVTTETSPEA